MATGSPGRAVDLLRRHPGVWVVLAAAVVVGLVLYLRGGEEESGPSRAAGSSSTPAAETPSGDAVDDADQGDGASDGEDDADEAAAVEQPEPSTTTGPTTTADVPLDVAHPRPPVDLGEAPDGRDLVEVARWWAGVYAAYAGAEPGAELAERLASRTTSSLQAQLASEPPAASSGEPLDIEGVSAARPQGEGDRRGVFVTVETPGSLLVYDLELQRGSDQRWKVSEVRQL